MAGVARKTAATSAKGGRTARRRKSAERPATAAHFTHFDAAGRARMVDVGEKAVTRRVAIARGGVEMEPATARLIAAGQVAKGDVLAAARLAGILAAKRTGELIPLCHPLPLDFVEVRIDVDAARGRVAIEAEARIAARTGVEMEALTARRRASRSTTCARRSIAG